MADIEIKTKEADDEQSDSSLIDPIYKSFTGSVMRALDSTEFYEFFMDAMSRSNHRIQFSNRREIKSVDPTWVEAIEEALDSVQGVINSPRSIIKEDELIVNIANAKKTGPDVVRHIAQHASLVESYDEATGDVHPNKVMQKYRDESNDLYENRVVYTTLERAYHFVKIRHDALFAVMNDEFGAKLKVNSDMSTATEQIKFDMFVHIKDIDSMMATDEKNRKIFERISRIYRLLSMFMNTPFAEQMKRLPKVHGAISKTNVLKKNPNYRTVVKLYEFLKSYDDIGYNIKVVEQNPVVSEEFRRDIFHNIMFNYIVLKGYLESERDRQTVTAAREKKRKLKPKFIKQIIEELTENYDLPDVEVRKVLIEELTREQLMQEEEAERLRLVEEAEARRREEEERARLEREAEEERIRLEREAEEERIRQEEAAKEELRLQAEKAKLAEERRRANLFRREIEYFRNHIYNQMEERREAAAEIIAETEDFADAVLILEETERLKREELERERTRRREEEERIKRKAELEAEAARKRSEERLAKLRLAKEEEEARLERERQEQRESEKQRCRELLVDYVRELRDFSEKLNDRMADRERQRAETEARELQRKLARDRRGA